MSLFDAPLSSSSSFVDAGPDAAPLNEPSVFAELDLMRAAVLAAPGEIRVEERPLPVPGAGEVRVRLEGCGVCASSLSMWEGREGFDYPRAPGEPGREGWGRVDAVGAGVEGLRSGDRVAMLSRHAYATHDVAPADAVVKLPAALDGQPFPGEPLGCAFNIFRRSDVQAGQTVAVVGVGFLGALLTGLAARAGARVLAISRRPFSLDVARRFGAAETIPMDDRGTVVERVKALTDGAGCERVVVCVGLQGPLDLAAGLTRERGRLVVAGFHQDGLGQVNVQRRNGRGLDVVDAHERAQAVCVRGLREAVDAVAAGRLDPSPLYTHTFPLDALPDAFRTLQERPDGFVKALVRM